MASVKWIYLVSTFALVTLTTEPALAQQEQVADDQHGVNEESRSGISAIIVTARKRAESAQEVPISISAFSPEELQEKQIVSIADLTKVTAGVSFQQSSTPSQFSVVIRGQNILDSTLNLDPAIGIYVDGVYIGPDIGNGLALNFDDAAGVEVLKGPQGTLYGRNTSGGALKLDHVIPGYETEGWIKAEIGNYDAYALRGAVTVPLAEEVATLRVYGRYQEHDGYGRNPWRGSDVLDERTYSFGGTLRLDPTPDFNLILRANYDKRKSDGLDNFPTAILPTTNVATLSVAIANGLPINLDGTLSPAVIDQAVGLFYAQGPSDRFDTNGRFPNNEDLELINGSLTATWDITPDMQLKSITGYRKINTYRGVDFSGGSTPLILTAQPLTYSQWSEELNLGGSAIDGRLDYTLGLFYLNSDGRDENYAVVAPFLGVAFGAASPIPLGQNIQIGDVKTKSYAAYAQATYEIVDDLNVTAGLRFTKEDKDLTTHNRFVFGGFDPITGFVDTGPEMLFDPVAGTGNTICFESAQGVGDACTASQPFTFKRLTWLGSVDYSITPDILIYAKTSRGFRSGGGQLRLGAGVANQFSIPPFGPEEVDDIEFGLKSDLFDRRVRANVSLYRGNYKGMQRTTLVVVNGAINSIIQSAGKSRVQGMEFELLAKPIPELTLGWTGAYTDVKYKEYRDGLGNDLSQQEFQGIADFVYTLSAAYRQPVSFGEIGLSVEYWHTSDVPLQPGAGPATTGGPTNSNPWATQKAYGLLNARAEVVLGNDLTIGVWGKNLADKEYFTYNLDVTASLGYANSWGGAPRTFGIDVRYDF